jgi:hypothetical protein
MKLSDPFSLDEMAVTEVRSMQAQNRQDALAYKDSLARIWEELLKPVCSLCGPDAKINVHSGFRCEELNKVVGGSPTSAHMRGEAVDFDIDGRKDRDSLLNDLCLIMSSPIPFGQLLIENGCLHISLPKKNGPNGEVAYWDKGNKTIMREAV